MTGSRPAISTADEPFESTLLIAEQVHGLVQGPPVRAVLIADRRITWTGWSPDDAPAHGRVVDARGAWVTPAFVDAHVHGTATGLALTGLDVTGAASVADCLSRLRRHAATLPAGEAVVGGGWDDFGWPEGRPPTAAEIAEAAPDRPVLLSRVDGHSALVDPQTLARMPLADLYGVDRDEQGAPTGWLREQSSEAARHAVLAGLSPRRLHEARQAAAARAAALGIGCLHEMGHPGISSLDDAVTWSTGEWPVEVLTWWAELDAEAGPAHGLRPGGDLFLDGSIGSHTAAVSRGYADGGHGELFHDDEAVADFFVACTRAGRGAGVHAIGDEAIEQALQAVEAAAEACGMDAVRSCRHRVEHVELPTDDHLARMANLDVVASLQPAFDAAWGGDDGLYAARFGVDAARGSNPFAAFADAGVTMAFGSDSTVTPMDPWAGVVAAERHRGGHGVGRLVAVAASTLGGRYVGGQDDVGPVAVGERADLSVWDADPFTMSDPRALRCLLTLVAGTPTHTQL